MDAQSISEMRKADKIIKAVIHPDTNKKIPAFFRMCNFVPVNIPIIFGMICTKQTPLNLILWQGINQTYNALWNYSNRNASAPFSNKEFGQAYSLAMSSSIGVALCTRFLLNLCSKGGAAGPKQRVLNSVVSMTASAVAGFLNLMFIRQNELKKGVDIKNPRTMESVGVSKLAAKKAVFSSAKTRSAVSVNLFIGAAGLMYAAQKFLGKQKKPVMIFVELTVCAFCLFYSLPISLALYPPVLTTNSKSLEPDFHNIIDTDGQIINNFIFNKGL
jgi:hypothetical protein